MSITLTLPSYGARLHPGCWVGLYDVAGTGRTEVVNVEPDTANTNYVINNSNSSRVVIDTNHGAAMLMYDVFGNTDHNWHLFRFPGADDPVAFGTVVSVNTNHSVATPEKVILAEVNATQINTTLPAAADYKNCLLYAKKTAGTAPVRLAGTVDGVSNPTLEAVHESAAMVSDGSSWYFLNEPRSFAEVNANATVTYPQRVVLADSTSAAVTVTLPTAASYKGKDIFVKQVAGSNTVILDGDGSEQIDGANTYTVTNTYASVHIFSDGSDWHILSEYLA